MDEKKEDSIEDLGLGTDTFQSCRIINPDGTFNVTREGYDFWAPYTSLVEMSWPRFLFIVWCVYVSVNMIFGTVYLLIGLEHVANIQISGVLWQDLLHATFFSIETFTTVGYGAL